uniref:Ig-like domain-containing protein n=1 Tax=Mola mola TaxID=94237 RepID=A0A3Q3X6H2_MOLML
MYIKFKGRSHFQCYLSQAASLRLNSELFCFCSLLYHYISHTVLYRNCKTVQRKCCMNATVCLWSSVWKTLTQFTGMWANATKQFIYHPVKSNIMQQYQNRTELVGDIMQKNCSLKIEPLQKSDTGPFYFRIEIADYDKFSYILKKVSIAMINELNPISLSVKRELTDGQTVSASCSAYYSCPTSPPVFTWSHSGRAVFKSEKIDDGQWQATSTLTFQPTGADHDKPIQCTARYPGGQHHTTFKVLKIKRKYGRHQSINQTLFTCYFSNESNCKSKCFMKPLRKQKQIEYLTYQEQK